jgi:hypothetical protein
MAATVTTPESPTLTANNTTTDGFDVTYNTVYAAPAVLTVSTELGKVVVSLAPSSPSQTRVCTVAAATGTFHVSMTGATDTYVTVKLVNTVGVPASLYYHWIKP